MGFKCRSVVFFICLSVSPIFDFYCFLFISMSWYCGAGVFRLIWCLPLSLSLALPTSVIKIIIIKQGSILTWYKYQFWWNLNSISAVSAISWIVLYIGNNYCSFILLLQLPWNDMFRSLPPRNLALPSPSERVSHVQKSAASKLGLVVAVWVGKSSLSTSVHFSIIIN